VDGDQEVVAFLDVVRRLRAECPWKASQTHRSLARYLLEETHETLEALDTGDTALLREELGDLLLQVFLHTAIAEQAGEFTTADVARDVTAKMVRRNPHVFGEDHDDLGAGLDPAAVNELWESRKAAEKQRASVTDGLAPGLPALLYADKVLDRLARAGSAVEVPESDELGDRLLALVAEARASGTDPEQALRDAVRRLL
jgi:XTP/dITP diphosphohydrolase